MIALIDLLITRIECEFDKMITLTRPNIKNCHGNSNQLGTKTLIMTHLNT